ncbi:MAG: DUF354 domain-containing protein [Terriglobia bacterium]
MDFPGENTTATSPRHRISRLNYVKAALNTSNGSRPAGALPANGGAGLEKVLAGKRIWIDLDNTPHVPFFAPIAEELRRLGCSVSFTARAAFQVCEMAALYHLDYTRVGRHYGKHTAFKALGLGVRALQLIPFAARERPHLALSHGSRSQLLAATILRIPSVLILDYEFARALLRPTWAMVPEVIPKSAVPFPADRLLRYPGIKEDVYAPRFKPDPGLRAQLGLNAGHVIATVRPPASEAHYHNPDSDRLFAAVMEFLGGQPETTTVLLPRNDRQGAWLRHTWPNLFSSGKAMIPQHAIDGLNLIWNSDLVISGGGTMNREAAALDVPVYSIFRGKIGAVDRYLAEKRRLVLIESATDIRTKLILKRRNRPEARRERNSAPLQKIVDDLVRITGASRSPQHRESGHSA